MANGALGALSAWLENKRRVARRQLGDLLSSPQDFGRMQADRFREDQEKYMSDPTAGLDFVAGPLGALAGVIKPKGGNWLTGSVENALKGLRKYAEPSDMELMRQNLATQHPTLSEIAKLRELEDVAVKAGKYDAADMFSSQAQTKLAQVAYDNARWQRELADMERNANLNSWIEGPLQKYIKTQMATPEDPVRALLEQGVSHDPRLYNFEAADRYVPTQLRYAREDAGFGQMGKSPAAKEWENITDTAVGIRKPGDLEIAEQAENPWLERLSPDEDVYDLPSPVLTSMGGFDHLTDELRNALNPESGLPRNLLLRPEQLKQMGMEKAVRHVDAINKWRAAQKAVADQELANKASVVREYTENNPKGLRWVELGKETPDLEAQLRYEGDTMGHCVGGYCDDVIEGRSRIFSLRDAKGEPHVTVEAANDVNTSTWIEQIAQPEVANRIWKHLEDKYGKNDDLIAENFSSYVESTPEFKAWLSQASPSIIQIKGKQNRAPKEEYLPFVQDFVRNSPLGTKWGDVGDFGNTGLKRAADYQHLFDREIAPLLGKEGERIGKHRFNAPEQEYMTPAEIRAWIESQAPEDVNPEFWQGLLNSIK